MIIAMAVFLAISFVISKKVKNAEEYYVAGRNAPAILIAGSLVASYTSTGLFMGDASVAYEGALGPMILLWGTLGPGYIFGAIFFGRYLRRSRALTIPEFFGKRFDSPALRKLAAVTAIITMGVYLISILQGIGTLMSTVTGVDYKLCILIAMVVFTIITVVSGSRGVLITDTLMAALFTAALIVGVIFIAKGLGGWFETIESLASNADTAPYLSWAGKPGILYDDGLSNVAYGLINGIAWFSVCMVGPWQVSRYQMAKNESVVVKSAVWSTIGIFVIQFICGMGAVMVNKVYPEMPDSSQVMIWACMNIMPKVLGILLLTGILSAGISSATTFQSLIGSMMANDVINVFGKDQEGKYSKEELDRRSIRTGRITVIIVALLVTAFTILNPPALFILLLFGGAIIAGSWMPVAVASALSKRITRTGAFAGMLTGFVVTFGLKLVSYFAGWTLPVYLEPCFVAIICNVIAMIIGSALTKVTDSEKQERRIMLTIPESEKEPSEIKSTMRSMKAGCFIGAFALIVLLVFWILPYYNGLA